MLNYHHYVKNLYTLILRFTCPWKTGLVDVLSGKGAQQLNRSNNNSKYQSINRSLLGKYLIRNLGSGSKEPVLNLSLMES